MPKDKFSNFRGLEKILVYKVHINEGVGVAEDPVYRETYYVTEEGKIIGKETKYEPRKFAGG